MNEIIFPLMEKFHEVSSWIKHCCSTYEIDPYLVAAVCWKESEFDPWRIRYEPGYYDRHCRNLDVAEMKCQVPGLIHVETERRMRAISWGPMQVMGGTARELGYSRLYLSQLCSEEGMRLGVIYLSKQLHRYTDVERAVSAYNAGSATSENRNAYVLPVMEHYQDLKRFQVFVS